MGEHSFGGGSIGFGSQSKREITEYTQPKLKSINPSGGQKKSTENDGKRFHNFDNLLRGKVEAHSKDIICADLSMDLDLIATGGRDNRVRVWDYERIIPAMDESNDEGPTFAHTSDVTLVKFIKPFPLLITADISGQLYIWLTKPHPQWN